MLSQQGKAVREIHDAGIIDSFKFMDMHTAVREFFAHQGRSERIKNTPYPRQYATIKMVFVKLFSLLLSFGLLGEFDGLNAGVTGVL